MILWLLLLVALPLQAEPLSENQSRFGVITGDVGLLTQGAVDWIEPHEALPLEVGDHIRTGEDGTVELIMSDNVFWILDPKTEVVVEHTEVNTGLLNLATGHLIGSVDAKRTVGTVQEWEFRTPAAAVIVRGAQFAISASPKESHVAVFAGKVDLQAAETAEGPQPVLEVVSGRESISKRGRPIQTYTKFSAPMAALAARRPAVLRRQNVIENTWSPFTPAVRKEMRSRFVSPAPKRKTIRKAPARKRRAQPAAS